MSTDPAPEAPWRPWWSVVLTALCLVLLGWVTTGFWPELVHHVQVWREHGQDLGSTLGVVGGTTGLLMVGAGIVPGVWFLGAGGRVWFWTCVGVTAFWMLAIAALLGDDLPRVLRSQLGL